jgi:hypothetical protein
VKQHSSIAEWRKRRVLFGRYAIRWAHPESDSAELRAVLPSRDLAAISGDNLEALIGSQVRPRESSGELLNSSLSTG